MKHARTAVMAVSMLGVLVGCNPAGTNSRQGSQLSLTAKTTIKSAPEGELSAEGDPSAELKYIEPVFDTGNDDVFPADALTPATEMRAATYIKYADEDEVKTPLNAFVAVSEKARLLAEQAYQPSPAPPEFLSKLTYDDYRMIDFKRDANLFAEDQGQFQLMLDPRGSLFKTEVKLSVLDGTDITPEHFDVSKFDFEPLTLTDAEKAQVGLAGFRLLSPLNAAGRLDEVMSVKGASFFRALGPGNTYGASARGIAIQTASPDGEEFPEFKEFWIRKPQMGEDALRFYALMDGPSVTGAYEFTVHIGAQTQVDVRASLFARQDTSRIGLAPLTSMFEFGPQDPQDKHTDFRPRVHDSEGLSAMLANGEWIWRPLTNPGTLQLSSFADNVPRGFGLMQRTRSFEDYQDIEAVYESRPSVWVTPGEGWRPGQLTLVEIPTPNEYNDNIISFWQLRDPLRKGERMDISYQLSWGMDAPIKPNLASVHATRTGMSETTKGRLFVVDFDVSDAKRMDGVEAKVSATSGKVSNVNVKVDEKRNRVRLSFELDAAGASASELRAVLTRVDRPVSETWLYRWSAT